jgi:ketosteroid isomerase-like protein
MSDFQAIADRVEIEALRAEFTDAAMMRDRARMASLFTSDGVLRMPDIPAEMTGREEIRVKGEQLHEDGWKFAERVYEMLYLDTTPLAGSSPSSS